MSRRNEEFSLSAATSIAGALLFGLVGGFFGAVIGSPFGSNGILIALLFMLVGMVFGLIRGFSSGSKMEIDLDESREAEKISKIIENELKMMDQSRQLATKQRHCEEAIVFARQLSQKKLNTEKSQAATELLEVCLSIKKILPAVYLVEKAERAASIAQCGKAKSAYNDALTCCRNAPFTDDDFRRARWHDENGISVTIELIEECRKKMKDLQTKKDSY